MINVIMILPEVEAMNYGVGSYVYQIIKEGGKTNLLHYHLISESPGIKKVEISRPTKHETRYRIPHPFNSKSLNDKKVCQRYYKHVTLLLKRYLGELKTGVFHNNFFQAGSLVYPLKEIYDFPVIAVVHYAQWQFHLNGNKQQFDKTWTKYQSGKMLSKAELGVIRHCNKEMMLYQRADWIISVTKYMKEFLRGYYQIAEEKCIVVPNGIKELKNNPLVLKDKIRTRLHIPTHEKIILFSGRVDAQKGIEPLIAAFKLLLSKYENVRLVIAGGIKIRNHTTLIGDAWPKINFLGQLSKEHLKKLYHIADIGVVPSLYDHCPYTVLEMMSYRLPIVASDTNGLNELIRHGDNGLQVKHEIGKRGQISINVEDLACQLYTLLTNPDKNISLMKQALNDVKTKFSAKSMMDGTLNVYKLAINNEKS